MESLVTDRHRSIIAAALKGGATAEEAQRLAWLDANCDVPEEQREAFLREQFAGMVGARVTTGRRGPFGGKPRHTVAKRYRARGRW